MSEFSNPARDGVRRAVEEERAAHEARARAEAEAAARTGAQAGTGAGAAERAEAAEATGIAAGVGTPVADTGRAEPYRPALGEQVRREQAEVDAMLLGTPAAPDPATRVPFAHEGLERAAHEPEVRVRPPGRRRGWAALGGTAATAALLASLGTAVVTGGFDQPAAQPASVAAAPAQVVPASSTSSTPDWQAVTATVGPSVVALDVVTAGGQGQGSGVVIDGEGNVLTNSHVVDGAREVTVSLADGRLYRAELVGQDETTDLAVVRIVDPPADLAPATLGTSADLAVGEAVLAMGNPLGLDSTATTGIISALDRPVVTQSRTASVVTNAIQVDAAVNPGNSGGPLFDAQGQVIGINTSIATLSGGGGPSGSIGLGFAIPVDQAADVAAQLIENGQAEHAFLGVRLADTTAEVDGVTRAGAGIGGVEPGSPAAEAGLRPGDVVTAIDAKAVDGAAALTGYVRQYTSGESATLTVARDGKTLEVEVTLATRA